MVERLSELIDTDVLSQVDRIDWLSNCDVRSGKPCAKTVRAIGY